MVMGINSFLTIVQEAQQSGTLEVLMTSPTQPALLVLLSALSAFAANVLQLAFYLGGGLLLSSAMLPRANLAGCAIVVLLSLAIAMAIGLFAAAVQLAIQKGSAVVWILGSGLWFLTGALFPVGALPRPLRFISTLLPVTHSLTGLRQALLQGVSLSALSHEIGILVLFSAFLLPLALLTFSFTLRRARREGTLSFY
jgi:ABC-2 type transport system permease protein